MVLTSFVYQCVLCGHLVHVSCPVVYRLHLEGEEGEVGRGASIMLIATPQITWHGGENGKNDPLLSADVHLSCGVLVTGGADADVRVSWACHACHSYPYYQDFLFPS